MSKEIKAMVSEALALLIEHVENAADGREMWNADREFILRFFIEHPCPEVLPVWEEYREVMK